MIVNIEELLEFITRHRNLKETTFKVLHSKLKCLNKYLNYDEEFYNKTEFNMDHLLNIDAIYRKLEIHYKPNTIYNQINLIIQILDINKIKYRDTIDEYKKIHNRLNYYKKKKICI